MERNPHSPNARPRRPDTRRHGRLTIPEFKYYFPYLNGHPRSTLATESARVPVESLKVANGASGAGSRMKVRSSESSSLKMLFLFLRQPQDKPFRKIGLRLGAYFVWAHRSTQVSEIGAWAQICFQRPLTVGGALVGNDL